MKRSASMFLVVLMLLCLLAPTAMAAPKEDLIIVMPEDLTSFDPLGGTGVPTQNIIRMIYTRLYIDSDDGSMDPVACLAKDLYAVSDNEIDVKIYTGWKYSDGSEITVDDVVFCLNRAKGSATFATTLKMVDGFEKIDDETIAIKTQAPVPSIKHTLKHVGTSILPQAYVEKALADNDWSNPICSGPYKVAERSIGEYTKVVKNEYYGGSIAIPQNNSLTFKYVPESTSRTIQIETGEADLNFSFGTADYARCKENPELKVYEKAGINTFHIAVDTTRAPFDDVRVRQALCYAIDRDDLLLAAAEGIGVTSYCVVPPTTMGHLDNPGNYSYDPDKARALLAEAGYADGFTTSLLAFNEKNKNVAEIVAMFLAEVGITANVDLYDASTRAGMVTDHQVPMLINTWGASPDADLVLPRLFTESAIGASNLTFYHNDELDVLLTKAGSIYDEAERTALYEEAVKILAEEAPWCPLFIQNSLGLARADLQGVVMSPESPRNFWGLHY